MNTRRKKVAVAIGGAICVSASLGMVEPAQADGHYGYGGYGGYGGGDLGGGYGGGDLGEPINGSPSNGTLLGDGTQVQLPGVNEPLPTSASLPVLGGSSTTTTSLGTTVPIPGDGVEPTLTLGGFGSLGVVLCGNPSACVLELDLYATAGFGLGSTDGLYLNYLDSVPYGSDDGSGTSYALLRMRTIGAQTAQLSLATTDGSGNYTGLDPANTDAPGVGPGYGVGVMLEAGVAESYYSGGYAGTYTGNPISILNVAPGTLGGTTNSFDVNLTITVPAGLPGDPGTLTDPTGPIGTIRDITASEFAVCASDACGTAAEFTRDFQLVSDWVLNVFATVLADGTVVEREVSMTTSVCNQPLRVDASGNVKNQFFELCDPAVAGTDTFGPNPALGIGGFSPRVSPLAFTLTSTEAPAPAPIALLGGGLLLLGASRWRRLHFS